MPAHPPGGAGASARGESRRTRARGEDPDQDRTEAAAAGFVHDVRVGRQAVYDRQRHIVSYQLILRGTRPGALTAGSAVTDQGMVCGDVRSGEQVTAQLIAAAFGTFGLDGVAGGKPVFINLTRPFLTGVLAIPVEPDNVVIEITDQIWVDHELLLGLAQLKQAGYRIAVDNYRGDPGRSALVELADFVKIDVDSLPSLVVPGLVSACRLTGATLLASHVGDAETWQRCLELGFELFQGEFLNQPAVLHRRVLSPSQMICVRLLNDLSDPEAPLPRIEQLVGSDPGLSMRLLRSAHSASGAGHQIESIRQALVLVGPRRLRSWVVLTLLEGTTTPNVADDLWSVLTRAHACQRLAAPASDMAYTVGLLSGAARLLGTDVISVADASGIGQDARAALVEGDGVVGHALKAIIAHEEEDEEGIRAEGLDDATVSRAYLDALQESLQLVHDFLGR
jgi:EAL and modified HD-GYP domain-containing signal transduction protein